jgi:hypothetical protein
MDAKLRLLPNKPCKNTTTGGAAGVGAAVEDTVGIDPNSICCNRTGVGVLSSVVAVVNDAGGRMDDVLVGDIIVVVLDVDTYCGCCSCGCGQTIRGDRDDSMARDR